MKNKKLLLLIAAPLAVVLILLIVLAFRGDSSVKEQATPGNTPSTSEETEAVTTTDAPSADVYYFSVKAPENATVLFDGQPVEYNKTTGLYQVFSEKKSGIILTVSKYGFETETIELDHDIGSDIEIEMKATEEYVTEAENAAKNYLMKIIDICNKGTGDLSTIIFFNDEDKTAVQTAVDAAIADMDVDTEDYITSEISVNSCKCEGMADSSKTISSDNAGEGSVVSFTVEYTYSWEYNGESYQDSGIDSEVHKPIVTVENIDGQWYLKDIYIYFRKNVH